MRTRTPRDLALFSDRHGKQSVWIKVEIDRDRAGSWVDVSNWNGLDFVHGVSYRESLDAGAWMAQVNLRLWQQGRPEVSLSPRMSASPLNVGGALCALHNPIRISTATTPIGAPRPSSYNEIFNGRIDKYSMSKGTLSLQCRDKAGELMDFFIEKELGYGSFVPAAPASTYHDLEEIMQNILDDHYNTAADIGGTASAPRTNPLSTRTTDGSPVQIYSDNGTSTTPFNRSTGAAVMYYTQVRTTLWEAIRAKADTIGWQLRYRWHEGSGIDAFVLVFEEPDKTKSTPDFELDPTSQQVAIDRWDLDKKDIRNVVAIPYAQDGTLRLQYDANDATSRSDYGRRYLGLTPAGQIDSLTEATTLGDNVLDYLKDPLGDVSLSIPYAYWVQLNDLVRLLPDGIYSDGNTDLAVLSRENSIMQGGPGLTRLTLKGIPKSKSAFWVTRTRNELQAPGDTGIVQATKSASGRLPNSNFSSRERQ